MAMSKVVEISASAVASRRIALIAASAFLLATVQAQAQQAQIAQDGRVIVTLPWLRIMHKSQVA